TDLPYIGFLPYRDQAPIMKSINAKIAAGERWENDWQFFEQTKPEEELYDTERDPDEVVNLAADPQFSDKLAELRAAHEAWAKEFGDLGQISEAELIKKLWPPNGKQPKTANPEIKRSSGMVEITSASEGASIAYRVLPNQRWQLYTASFAAPDDAKIEAQAIRYGWKKSDVVAK
ncbi:MAG: sulfatase, partial [Verrucomicrobiota bacterium]